MRPATSENLKVVAANIESAGSWFNKTCEDDKDVDLHEITKAIITNYILMADMTEEVKCKTSVES